MNFLAIDASEKTLSLCLRQSTRELELYTDKLSRIEQLPRLVKELLGRHQIEAQQLAGLSLIQGPGSYTGLRGSLLLAKSMALYKAVPVMLRKRQDVSLFACRDYPGPVMSLQSVRLNQFYVAIGRFVQDKIDYLLEPALHNLEEILALQTLHQCPVTGEWPGDSRIQPEKLEEPNLAQVLADWTKIQFTPCPVEDLVPFYVRAAVVTPKAAQN